MSWQTRQRAERWILLALLLGVTLLGASWLDRGAKGAGPVEPAPPGPVAFPGEDPQFSPPRIVFPASDEGPAWDGPALEKRQ